MIVVANSAEKAAPAFQMNDRRPAFGCIRLLLNSDIGFKMVILNSFHFRLRSEEMFYIVPSDVARNSPDSVEAYTSRAAGIAEAAGALRFFIFYDTGLGAVAAFLHQIENIYAVAEFYVNGRSAPLCAEGLVAHIDRPRGGMGCGVQVHGCHLIRIGSCESAADQFIRELMTYVLRRRHSFHFSCTEDGPVGNLVPVILRSHL